MNRALRHLRQNLVAYLALFVALGGTSYAAITIPRNSVGARQIRNHSINPVKLNGRYFGGYVRLWAQIDQSGHVIASRPRGAQILQWNSSPNTPFTGGSIRWPTGIAAGCFPVVSSAGFVVGSGPASVSAELNGAPGRRFVVIYDSEPTAVNVLVVCPTP
ncbi:MAG TPA: hypothetical protein VFN55_03960 [Solirubrobacteraceae bacterium]|nr:hypothetical protein [Solirubrobacteraceae bacterium]